MSAKLANGKAGCPLASLARDDGRLGRALADQAVGFEVAQRLAHGDQADAEMLGKARLLGQLAADRETALRYRPAQDLRQLAVERPLFAGERPAREQGFDRSSRRASCSPIRPGGCGRCGHPSARPRRPAARSPRGARPTGASISTTRLVGLDLGDGLAGADGLAHAFSQPTRRPSLTVRSPNGIAIAASSFGQRGGRCGWLVDHRRGLATALPAALRQPRRPGARQWPGTGAHAGDHARGRLRRCARRRPAWRAPAPARTDARSGRVCRRPTGASSSSKASSLIAWRELGADAAHRPGLVDDQQAVGLARRSRRRSRRRAA